MVHAASGFFWFSDHSCIFLMIFFAFVIVQTTMPVTGGSTDEKTFQTLLEITVREETIRAELPIRTERLAENVAKRDMLQKQVSFGKLSAYTVSYIAMLSTMCVYLGCALLALLDLVGGLQVCVSNGHHTACYNR